MWKVLQFIWKNKAWTIPMIQQGYKFVKPYVKKGYEKIKKIITKDKLLPPTETTKPKASERDDK